MNSAIRQTFAIPAACSPVNELLTAIMRSFGEQPAQPRDSGTADNRTTDQGSETKDQRRETTDG